MQRRTALALLAAVVVCVVGALVVGTFVLGLGDQVSSTGPVGLAAGGANDGTAFRNNVREGYVPQPTDATAAGVFHDYRFRTTRVNCDRVLCPTADRVVSRDPLSNRTEYYAAVGFDSGLSRANLSRPPLNLVVVVDTSGSMDSGFPRYHYGERGRTATSRRTPTEGASVTKMEAARQSVRAMTDQLNASDRLAVVAYDDSARVVHPMRRVGDIRMVRFDARIDSLRADGGTNLDAGMRTATDIARRHAEPDSERATRVVYVTDAMPNRGETDSGTLRRRLADDAADGIHTTFVGVGVDFNTRLTTALNEVEGANQYTVRSPSAFRERMGEEFTHMVTPLAYDLRVRVESEGFAVDRVYGAPGDGPRSSVVRVATLFPSRRDERGAEGGVMLVRLRRTGDGPKQATLNATYRTPDGEYQTSVRRMDFQGLNGPHYDSSGARKAVALSRYVALVQEWASYERRAGAGGAVPPDTSASIDHQRPTGEWEQRGVSLRVSPPYGERFDRFAAYMTREKRALGSERMSRDLAIVRQLANQTRSGSGSGPEPTPTATASPTA